MTMKENILITGRLGAGKSSLVKRLLEHIPHGAASGFLTEEIRDGFNRAGLRVAVLGTKPDRSGLGCLIVEIFSKCFKRSRV